MKAYTYNDRLVGVGNDQILGTDQGGGSTYTAGDYISIENDEINVTGISAGDGILSIAQNVTGVPVNIIYPTDVASDAVFYQINSVTGNAYTASTGSCAVNYYYGETPANFNDSNDTILITINDDISNISYINFYYSNSVSGIGGPGLSTTGINSDSTYTLPSGTYKVKAQYNPAPGAGYGNYLQIMFSWKDYASDAAQSLEWAQDAMSKITFFGVVRSDPTLGIDVNLDRYYIGGNIVGTKPSDYGLRTQVWTDPDTKKQEVFLPTSIPSNWMNRMVQFVQYGSNYFSPSGYNTSQQYIAYKYTSSPTRYQYAFCTDHDTTNKKMTFISYNESGQAIEKWTVNYTNSSSNVWSTETLSYATEAEIQAVSGALDDYIPYSASGVYLPNSKFEIDTEGQAYKVIVAGSETAFNHFDDYGILFYYSYTELGTYKAILPSNTDHLSISSREGIQLTSDYDSTTHTAIFNITELPNGSYAHVYAYDSNNNFISLSSNNTTVKYILLAVTEEYLTDGDLELNNDNQVTAIDGYALAGGGGTEYTAGQYISIDSNDVIAVTGLAQADWAVTAVDSPAYIENKPETLEMELSPVTGGNCISITEGNAGSIDWITTAGITDIVSVSALPDTPVATVIYLIPET